jgi:hypothetical protein
MVTHASHYFLHKANHSFSVNPLNILHDYVARSSQSYNSFLLPSYAKAQALALESLASPPSLIVSQGYHPGVKTFINYETLEDV